MRLLLLVLGGWLAIASPPQNSRRIDYPAEKFSIAIPESWHEIQPAVLGIMSSAIPRAANLPEIKIRHGYTPRTEPPLFPWVAIIITEDPVDEAMFDNPEWTRRRFEDSLVLRQSSGSLLQRAQLDSLTYDRERRLLWNITQSTAAGIGALRNLSGSYLTRQGSIQVHCYSKAEDFAKDQAVCREMIESVTLDPTIVLPPRLDSADYRTIVRQLEAGNLAVNFRSLRMACMKSPECEPRASSADLAEFNAASRAGQNRKVVEIGRRLIQRGFVNLEVHAACVMAYRALEDQAKSRFHMSVAEGLLRSILFSGDGATKETAYEVISDREEISTLASRRLPYSGSGVSTSQLEEGGHRYDRWEILDPINEKTVVVYFNTDAFTAKSRPPAN